MAFKTTVFKYIRENLTVLQSGLYFLIINHQLRSDITGTRGRTNRPVSHSPAASDAIGMEKVAANGNTIHTMGEAETAEIKEIATGVTARWIETMDEKGFDGAQLVEDARAMIAAEEAKRAAAQTN